MELSLKFRYRGARDTQFRSAIRIKIDRQGHLILYGASDTVLERLTLRRIVDLSISWGETQMKVARASG